MTNKKRRIIVSGLAVTFPLGGVFWDYIQYLHGLYLLGHDVYYLEDTGGWVYDPEAMTFVEDFHCNVEKLRGFLKSLSPDLEKRFCIRGPNEKFWGLDEKAFRTIISHADVFINISATCQLREEYLKIPVKILIDSDPLYTQASIPDYLAGTIDAKSKQNIDNLLKHDLFFSFGENIGRDDCLVPDELFAWQPTRQPIVLESWKNPLVPRRKVFTTVLSWQPIQQNLTVNGVEYGGKNKEFLGLVDLPQKTGATLELAMGGGKAPEDLLREYGWQIVNGHEMSSSADVYRDYIENSLAEFSTAKNAYVASKSGWFSCRSACYLAAGRPVVVQDTGFSRIIPSGLGIVSFTNEEEALNGLESVLGNWEKHSQEAVRLASEYFDSHKVLHKLLSDAEVI